MPEPHTLLLFAATALLFAASPGPNFIYVLTRSLSYGRAEGLMSVLGIGTGALFHTLAAVLGLSALLATSALAFSVVKYAGAAYLVYLGVRTLLSRSAQTWDVVEGTRNHAAAYRQGLVTMILNPKAALYFLAFLPQFVDPSRGTAAGQLLLFGVIQTFTEVSVFVCLVLIAGLVSSWLRRSATFVRAQKWLAGCTYIALGTGLALTGGRK